MGFSRLRCFTAKTGERAIRPSAYEPISTARPSLSNSIYYPYLVREGIPCEVLNCLFEFISQLPQCDPPGCRVCPVELGFEIFQLSPRCSQVLCLKGLLYLLATNFDACEVGSIRGIAIKAFFDLLKRWTCPRLNIQLLTFADVLLLYRVEAPFW